MNHLRHVSKPLSFLSEYPGHADPHFCWSSRQLAPGFPTASVCGLETGAHSLLWMEGLLVLLSFLTPAPAVSCGAGPQITLPLLFGDPRTAGERSSRASLSGCRSWQSLGKEGPNSPIRSGCEVAMLLGMAQLMVPGDTPCLALFSCFSSSRASGIKLCISAWAEVPPGSQTRDGGKCLGLCSNSPNKRTERFTPEQSPARPMTSPEWLVGPGLW